MARMVKVEGKTKDFSKASDAAVVRWMLILRPSIITATLGMAILYMPSEITDKKPLIIVVLGTYILSLLYWFSNKFLGTSKPLLAIQITFDIFLITAIVITTDAYNSPFIGFYFLSIMCASLFFRRFVTLLFSIQSIVFYVFALVVVSQMGAAYSITDIEKTVIKLQAFMFTCDDL